MGRRPSWLIQGRNLGKVNPGVNSRNTDTITTTIAASLTTTTEWRYLLLVTRNHPKFQVICSKFEVKLQLFHLCRSEDRRATKSATWEAKGVTADQDICVPGLLPQLSIVN